MSGSLPADGSSVPTTPSESGVKLVLDELLRGHTRSKFATYATWTPLMLASLTLSNTVYVIAMGLSCFGIWMWERYWKQKGVDAFNECFPEGRPEREIALRLLEGRIKDNYDTKRLFQALGGAERPASGGMTLSLLSDGMPADERMEDALAQLEPKPAIANPAPVSRPAPTLDHIPLQPDDQAPPRGRT